MKTFRALTLCAVLATGLFTATDAVAQFERRAPGDRVCFYQDINYQGWEQCYNSGDEIPNLDGRKNNISSLRIYGRARVVVYEDTNFRGSSDEFSNSVPDLGRRVMSGDRTWSDRIDSIRVNNPDFRPYGNRDYEPRDTRPQRGIVWGRNQNLREGICVYEHANYQGRSECWTSGDVADLGRIAGWSDVISSVRIFGRSAAVFYRDAGFRGERIWVDNDIPDLGRVRMSGFASWNDQISSIQYESDRGNRGRGYGPGRQR